MELSGDQKNRVQLERKILKKHFPAFEWNDLDDKACIDLWMKTTLGNNFKVRLFIPNDIPNSMPKVLIVYPSPLPDHWGKNLHEYGCSGSMHLHSPKNGYVNICYSNSSNWSPNITFYKVFVKTRLWLEAYEAHKNSGKDIDYFLKHQ